MYGWSLTCSKVIIPFLILANLQKKFKSTTSGFFHGFALTHNITAQLAMVEEEDEQKQTGAKGYFVCCWEEKKKQYQNMPTDLIAQCLSQPCVLVCEWDTLSSCSEIKRNVTVTWLTWLGTSKYSHRFHKACDGQKITDVLWEPAHL